MKCPNCGGRLIFNAIGDYATIECENGDWDRDLAETTLENKLEEFVASLNQDEFVEDNDLIYDPS